MSLGSNIRNKRKSLKLSQEYVAEQLHVSRQAVSKWEMEKSEPSTNNLIKLAALFSCDVGELLPTDKNVTEEKSLNSNQKTTLRIVGIILSLILFAVGMSYVVQVPFLGIVSVLGLSGTCYFVYRIVGNGMKSRN